MCFAQTAALQLCGCAVVVCGCDGAATAASAGALAAAAAVALAAVAGSTQSVTHIMLLRSLPSFEPASSCLLGLQAQCIAQQAGAAQEACSAHSRPPSPAQLGPPSPARPAATGPAESSVNYGAGELGGANWRQLAPRGWRAGNLRVPAGTLHFTRRKACFFQAKKQDRRGPVGDVPRAR